MISKLARARLPVSSRSRSFITAMSYNLAKKQ